MSRFSLSWRPGDRNPLNPWFRVGTLDVTTTVLVVGIGALSMFVWAVDPQLFRHFWLFAGEVRSGELWRLATWPLFNEPEIWTAITLALFWYFGRALEGEMGRYKFLGFLLAMAIVPGIVATALNLDVGGIRYVEIAVFGAFAIEYPRAQFFFGIPARVIALVFLGIEVLQLTGLRDTDGLLFLAVVIVTMLFALRAVGLGADIPWVPRVPLPGAKSPRRPPKKPEAPKQKRGRGTVVPFPTAASGSLHTTQQELDRLLDKISASGIESLTKEERARLEEASKRLRGQ